MTMDCLFLGGSSVDIILDVPRMPVRDEKLLANVVGVMPGGLVANTACAAGRMGLATSWAGLIGDDAGGKQVLSAFEDFNVDTRWVEVLPGQMSDFCVILLDDARERSILVCNTTANLPTFTPELFQAMGDYRVTYLIPQPVDVFKPVAERVHAAGRQIAIDIEAGRGLCDEDLLFAIRHADIIFTTGDALRQITGESEPEPGAQRWLAMGVSHVIVTLGSKGAWAFRTGESAYHPGYRVPVVDTTGAGDCFHGAFLYGLLSGWSLNEMLTYSNAAAALSVQKLGARDGLPTPGEVQEFLARQTPRD